MCGIVPNVRWRSFLTGCGSKPSVKSQRLGLCKMRDCKFLFFFFKNPANNTKKKKKTVSYGSKENDLEVEPSDESFHVHPGQQRLTCVLWTNDVHNIAFDRDLCAPRCFLRTGVSFLAKVSLAPVARLSVASVSCNLLLIEVE